MMKITWVVEPETFDESYAAFLDAIEKAGHRRLRWKDDWWTKGETIPLLQDVPVVFHGSLGNANRIATETPWKPGAYCDAEAFACSSWYEQAREWLVHDLWISTTVEKLVADPLTIAGDLAKDGKVFVRPESPLKPFSGRVCALEGIRPADLDHGFYFDDLSLPIIVAPVREIGKEWRFIVVDRTIVAGSGYEADGRSAVSSESESAFARASEIAAAFTPPQPVYVLDLAECDGELRLVELNPFSGADLYGCDAASIVEAVSERAVLDFKGPS